MPWKTAPLVPKEAAPPMPAVSVVIPTHNRARFVPAAIESALAQSFTDLEVIVVDDASIDGTADLLAANFGARVRVERLPFNHGRSTARNVGWSLARGEFIAFLDSDDLWRPEKLALQVPHFERPEVVLSHTWAEKIDPLGQPLPAASAELRREFLFASRRGFDYAGITQTWCRMYTSAVVLRRELLNQTGGFDPRLSNFEDYDLFWRAALAGEIATVEEPLLLHRTHTGNTPSHWPSDAIPWLAVMRKHLLEPAIPARGRTNLMVNMAIGEYWRGHFGASRRWIWQALLRDPALFTRPAFYTWGAPFLRSVLPRFLAEKAIDRAGADPYTDRSVTLVMDDGPTDSTPQLLDCLEAAGHRAVLFVLGCNIAGREAVLIDAVRRGFALGNHSFDHPHFSILDLAEARREIERTEAAIEAIYAQARVPRPAKWFRFPYLDTGEHHRVRFQTLLREFGFARPHALGARLQPEARTRLDWPSTLRTLDWEFPPDSRFRRSLRRARPGDIIECHDSPGTVERFVRPLTEELARLRLRATVPQP